MTLRIVLFFVVLIWPAITLGFDYNFEGRTRIGGTLTFEPPDNFSHTDREAELRIGVLGTAVESEEWVLDYEIIGDIRHEGGALEQAGIGEEIEADFFRAWARIDRGNVKLRGGRQQILFGSGMLFRPLGFFDGRVISGIIPQTFGADGIRGTWFPDDESLVEGWLVPSGIDSRMISGIRGETQWGMLEVGVAAQYKPVSNKSFLPNFNLELAQFGFHFKGEKVVGFWNESRIDVEQGGRGSPLRLHSVFGMDYTFDVGEGLHALIEYSLITEEAAFTRTDFLQGDQTLHQLGIQLDQPVGISTVWRMFMFFDLVDRSFQLVPQVEYALTETTFLYLQAQIGGNIEGNERNGRLFRKTPIPNGGESKIGMTLITFF
ncbi:MAG: hypothetical protein G3M70_17045 [Candidatus Nitronauta litoralis]|uniref:Porin n=1 Tax=Candidatus Nitronauta litoralis TaxID=2705533 RepID=A0A7T0BYY3_9BACT|nr:MAG: hypothetical protein G3M70_17045 [Candidatus Nitronauta litoralis]